MTTVGHRPRLAGAGLLPASLIAAATVVAELAGLPVARNRDRPAEAAGMSSPAQR